jgi:hypothetical protein
MMDRYGSDYDLEADLNLEEDLDADEDEAYDLDDEAMDDDEVLLDGMDDDEGFDESMDEYDEAERYYDDEGGDEIFGGLRRIGRKIGGAAKRAARRLARIAKRKAASIGGVIGGAVAGPAGAAIGGKVGNFVKNLEDGELDYDSEDEMNASVLIPATDEESAEAMAASAARSIPSDAQALGGALTITIMSKAPMRVRFLAPTVAAAAGRIAKTLAADSRSRPLVKTVPTIVKKTYASLDRKTKKGKPVDRRTVARVMTKHAKKTLGSPKALAGALANNAVKRRRLNTKAIARAEKYY